MKCFGRKSKTYPCKIILLDETHFSQEVKSFSLGQELLDAVVSHLNLTETNYFGLRYLDNINQTRWLDLNKKAVRQLKGNTTPFVLYFGVKFYASDPCRLTEEGTRYQFFLQLKQDVLQGRLPVSFDLAAELAAYAIQSELGDYDPRRHLIGYVSEFRFVANQSEEMENKIADLHKGLIGQVPAMAEYNYLEKVKWLDMYGVDLHPVLGEDNIEYFLGLTPSGIIVLRNKTKVGNYFWPRITKVYFKAKYFMLRVRDKHNDESTYGFELPTKHACKHLWKCCVDHHAFFRLMQVSTVPSGSFYGSRFRQSQQSGVRSTAPVVRVPSKRYQRRLPPTDGIDNSLKDMVSFERTPTVIERPVSIPLPTEIPSVPTIPMVLPLSDSPRSTRSAPWVNCKQGSVKGLFSSSTNPSPRSVRSVSRKHRRSSSADSESSIDGRRRRSHHRRGSLNDNDSARSSIGSHHRGRKSRSNSRTRDENGEHHQKHRYKSREKQEVELVSLDTQWQQSHQTPTKSYQSAVIRDLHTHKIGSNSRSPSNSKKQPPEELRRHFQYVETTNLSTDQLRNIPYIRVQMK